MRINGEAVNILRLRAQGWDISTLARKSGVDRTVIHRIEKGERRGTPAQAKALADALEVPVVMLLKTELPPELAALRDPAA